MPPEIPIAALLRIAGTSILGMSVVIWASVLWVVLTGTFGVIMLYRYFIRYGEQDKLLIGAAESRRNAAHRRDVDRAATGFGVAAAVLLILIAVMALCVQW